MSHSHLMELSSCQIFNLSVMEQIDAPKDSVLGLYSNTGRAHVALLATDIFPFHINTYQGSGNLDDDIGNVFNDANYNIAIRVHIGEYTNLPLCCLHYVVTYIYSTLVQLHITSVV